MGIFPGPSELSALEEVSLRRGSTVQVFIRSPWEVCIALPCMLSLHLQRSQAWLRQICTLSTSTVIKQDKTMLVQHTCFMTWFLVITQFNFLNWAESRKGGKQSGGTGDWGRASCRLDWRLRCSVSLSYPNSQLANRKLWLLSWFPVMSSPWPDIDEFMAEFVAFLCEQWRTGTISLDIRKYKSTCVLSRMQND